MSGGRIIPPEGVGEIAAIGSRILQGDSVLHYFSPMSCPDPDTATSRIRDLREALERHNRLYYDEAAPVISDQEYDALYRELADLETAFPQFWPFPS